MGLGCVRAATWAGGDALDILLRIHDTLASTLRLYLLIVGGWGAIVGVPAWLRNRPESPFSSGYRGTLVIAEIVLAVQGFVGLLLLLLGAPLGSTIHVLYGILSIVALPFAYSYVEDRKRAGRPVREWLVYGLVALFVFGLVLRASTTS